MANTYINGDIDINGSIHNTGIFNFNDIMYYNLDELKESTYPEAWLSEEPKTVMRSMSINEKLGKTYIFTNKGAFSYNTITHDIIFENGTVSGVQVIANNTTNGNTYWFRMNNKSYALFLVTANELISYLIDGNTSALHGISIANNTILIENAPRSVGAISYSSQGTGENVLRLTVPFADKSYATFRLTINDATKTYVADITTNDINCATGEKCIPWSNYRELCIIDSNKREFKKHIRFENSVAIESTYKLMSSQEGDKPTSELELMTNSAYNLTVTVNGTATNATIRFYLFRGITDGSLYFGYSTENVIYIDNRNNYGSCAINKSYMALKDEHGYAIQFLFATDTEFIQKRLTHDSLVTLYNAITKQQFTSDLSTLLDTNTLRIAHGGSGALEYFTNDTVNRLFKCKWSDRYMDIPYDKPGMFHLINTIPIERNEGDVLYSYTGIILINNHIYTQTGGVHITTNIECPLLTSIMNRLHTLENKLNKL
jgi:hypothetical protein